MVQNWVSKGSSIINFDIENWFKVTACHFYTNTFILLMYEPSRIKEREYMIRTGYFKEM